MEDVQFTVSWEETLCIGSLQQLQKQQRLSQRKKKKKAPQNNNNKNRKPKEIKESSPTALQTLLLIFPSYQENECQLQLLWRQEPTGMEEVVERASKIRNNSPFYIGIYSSAT